MLPMAVRTAAAASCSSAAVTVASKLKRTAAWATSASTPIARSTGEGSSEPAAQAEPLEQMTPSRSSSSSTDSPLVPGKQNEATEGSRSLGWPCAMSSSAVQAGVPGAVLTGHPSERLPSVASFCFPGTSGESVLLELERLGVICSSGSACAAGSDEPSPVLRAMGIDAEVAQTAVRFSFDSTITAAELQEAAAAVRTAVGSVQALGAP